MYWQKGGPCPRRRLEARALANGKGQPSKLKQPRPTQSEGEASGEMLKAEHHLPQRAEEVEAVRELHPHVMGKRVIKGSLNVTPLPKCPRLQTRKWSSSSPMMPKGKSH